MVAFQLLASPLEVMLKIRLIVSNDSASRWGNHPKDLVAILACDTISHTLASLFIDGFVRIFFRMFDTI